MTELEAARFRRDLDTALGHERAVVAAPGHARRRFNWAPVFSVAAILIALVLVAPALQLLGGGGDDAGADARLAARKSPRSRLPMMQAEPSAIAAPRSASLPGTDDAFAAAEAPTSTVAADGDLHRKRCERGHRRGLAERAVDDQLLELWEALDEERRRRDGSHHRARIRHWAVNP